MTPRETIMIYALRDAITAAGGTPTQFTEIGLLHELITAWGGTPTQFTIEGLLREAIVASGGTPTQFAALPLLRELVTARGGTATSYSFGVLLGQVVELAAVSDPLSNALSNGDFSTSDAWILAGGAAISGGQLIADNSNEDVDIYQSVDLLPSHAYPTSFTISALTSGSARLVIGGAGGTWRNAAGTYEETIAAGAGDTVRIEVAPFANMIIDDVVVDNSGVLLAALSLDPASINEDAASGTSVGAVQARTAGSTLSLINDAGGRFALDLSLIETGATPLDYESATSHEITVRETHPAAVNSPRDTVITIEVTDVTD